MGTALGWGIFLRSLLVQASWSFATMQSPGFFLMTWPALARRELPAAETLSIGLRRLRHFNTHPYFGGLVAAVVVREEALGAPADTIEGLKHSLMCALGAVGDEFFWATLRPFAAIAALPAALAGFAWAPLLLLAVYNTPHLAVRAWGVSAGLARGRGVVDSLQRLPLSRALPALGAAMAFGVGLLLGAGAGDPAWGLLPGRGLLSVAAAAFAFALLLLVQRRVEGQGRVLAALSATAAVAAAVRVAVVP